MQAIQTESQALLTAIFSEKKELYISKATRLLSCRDAAKDVVYSAFEKLYSKQFSDNNIAGLLYTVVKNEAMDLLRKRQTSEIGENDIVFSQDPCEIQNKKEVIKQGIEQLPENHKKVIELFYYKELKYVEIAAQLDIPIGTVKTWLNLAKQQLRGNAAIMQLR